MLKRKKPVQQYRDKQNQQTSYKVAQQRNRGEKQAEQNKNKTNTLISQTINWIPNPFI
jgi:hypothetical protein